VPAVRAQLCCFAVLIAGVTAAESPSGSDDFSALEKRIFERYAAGDREAASVLLAESLDRFRSTSSLPRETEVLIEPPSASPEILRRVQTRLRALVARCDAETLSIGKTASCERVARVGCLLDRIDARELAGRGEHAAASVIYERLGFGSGSACAPHRELAAAAVNEAVLAADSKRAHELSKRYYEDFPVQAMPIVPYSGGRYGHGIGVFARRAPVASVVAGEPEVEGPLDREVIRAIIQRNRNQIRYCYESQLNRVPALQGEVAVKFMIAANGDVSSAQVVRSSVEQPELEGCVAGRVRTWLFPKPKGGAAVTVIYPFVFSQRTEAPDAGSTPDASAD
jgi:TonB family protein